MGVASSPDRQPPHPVRNPTRLGGCQAEPARREVLDLVALVAAVEPTAHVGDPAPLGPEDRGILGSCREPVTVAEAAVATALPVSVVRVRLAALIRRPGRPPGAAVRRRADRPRLLNEVLDGLRTL
jgi:Protein of unknown function (DUF742)